LYALLPRELMDRYGESLRDKEQKLVSSYQSYDVHQFFEGLSGSRVYCDVWVDLMLDWVAEGRSCD